MITPRNNYTCHSGGAIGADSIFGDVCRQYCIVCKHFYFEGFKTPRGNCRVPNELYPLGLTVINELVNNGFRRLPKADYVRSLLVRNFFQVDKSEAVFAVAPLVNFKEVSGGTGWAVEIAKKQHKLIFVFNTTDNQWYKYNYELPTKPFGRFNVYSDIPVLTQKFAGIGTREITLQGVHAIQALFANSLS